MPVRIRLAVNADQAFLVQLTNRLAAFPLPPWRTAAEIAEADHPILLDALAHPSPENLIAVAEDDVETQLGYVFVSTKVDYFTAERHGHIEIVAVDEGATGRGVGQLLMAEAERWAAARGYRFLTLSVFATNQRALNLYDRLGYQPELFRYRKAVGGL